MLFRTLQMLFLSHLYILNAWSQGKFTIKQEILDDPVGTSVTFEVTIKCVDPGCRSISLCHFNEITCLFNNNNEKMHKLHKLKKQYKLKYYILV